ncbi:hypothetical protein Taro_041883 [Colocasia esculenta]|uniref:Uncharacterized protein n=1 Tax=Colocasia esculenta TaxID=4460 RepID=A0A843WYG1_COLES|nr:hypothetical protein [Colocasia esculenta]
MSPVAIYYCCCFCRGPLLCSHQLLQSPLSTHPRSALDLFVAPLSSSLCHYNPLLHRCYNHDFLSHVSLHHLPNSLLHPRYHCYLSDIAIVFITTTIAPTTNSSPSTSCYCVDQTNIGTAPFLCLPSSRGPRDISPTTLLCGARCPSPADSFDVAVGHPSLATIGHFKRFFICFYACIIAFQMSCRPLLFLDGIFLKDEYQDKFLVAIVLNGQNELFSPDYAACDGLLQVIPHLFSNSHKDFCLQCLTYNFAKFLIGKCSSLTKDVVIELLKKATYVIIAAKFEKAMVEMRELCVQAEMWAQKENPNY